VHSEAESPTGAYHRPVRDADAQRSYEIAVLAGPGAGLHRPFDADELRVGKAPSNDLCLPDPTVSRFHCVIERTARGLLLRDLGSSNGTQVGGCWVQSVYLRPEVPVQAGQSIMQVRIADAERPAAAPRAPLLGTSAETQRLIALLPQLARTGGTVLLEGETGTGKSLIARMIHSLGPRAAGPFVVVDAGALAPSLIESELFGHERGSFTGATERRVGAFESAHAGTVFLDEIGELPLELQPKLLRALEERVVRRVGSSQTVHLDVQVIAATNRNLSQAVKEGRFRADLYYRLEALRLTIPALRERRDDIPPLVEHFCRRTMADVDEALVQTLKQKFLHLAWPGNVRQLRNAVERAVLMGAFEHDLDLAASPGPESMAPTPPPETTGSASLRLSFREAKEEAIAQWERDYLPRLMREAGGNLSRAARMARIDRGHLRELLRQQPLADH
jgi:DNA-binding NtrC family response regulator